MALADQGIVSAANFLIMIMMARWLPADQFAVYALIITLFQFTAAIQRAWVTQPIDVLSPRESNNELAIRRAAATSMTMLCALAGSICIAISTLWLPLSALGWLAASLYFVAFFRLELARRLSYAAGHISDTIGPSVIAYWPLLLTLIGLSIFYPAGDTGSALLLLAVGMALGALLSEIVINHRHGRLLQLPWQTTRQYAKSHFSFAKWLIASQLVFFASTELYTFYIYSQLSPAEAGSFRAGTSVVNIFNIIRLTLVNYLPRIFTLSHANESAKNFGALLMRSALTTLVIGAAMAASLSLSADWLSETLYSSKYENVAAVIIYVSWMQALSLFSVVLNAGSAVLRITHHIFLAHSFGAVFSILFGYWLVRTSGMTGALCGVAVGLLLPVVVQLALFIRHIRTNSRRSAS